MQRKETQEHFRTQAEFQQEIKRQLEEQAEQQMKVILCSFILLHTMKFTWHGI